jgi:hypothetical protein
MARLRLNQEYRNKISNRMRVHLEQENTQEKENFFQLRENMKPLQDETWKLAKKIVSRHYTPEDIKMAYHLQNKFENINIEQKDNASNPHWTKFEDANEKYLGLGARNSNEDHVSFSADWNKDFVLDLIGREYCRDRSIKCEKQEYDMLMVWQQAKGQLIMAHEKWISSVINQVSKIKTWLKTWKYLDEALDFAAKANCPIDEAEIIRCNSTGLAIFNPQNCADYLESMKNKNISREDKILARLKYDKQSQS